MTTNPAAWTADEAIEWLAGLEKPCPCGGTELTTGYLDSERTEEVLPCPDCAGTGGVARFPGLRERCRRRRGTFAGTVIDPDTGDTARIPATPGVHPDDCGACVGRGWLPRRSDRLEAVLEAIRGQGWTYTLTSTKSRDYCIVEQPQRQHRTYGRGDTPLEAASRALCAAAAQAQEGA